MKTGLVIEDNAKRNAMKLYEALNSLLAAVEDLDLESVNVYDLDKVFSKASMLIDEVENEG